MIMGYGIIAVPTGIVSAQYSRSGKRDVDTNTQACPNCNASHHKDKAVHCYKCGEELNPDENNK